MKKRISEQVCEKRMHSITNERILIKSKTIFFFLFCALLSCPSLPSSAGPICQTIYRFELRPEFLLLKGGHSANFPIRFCTEVERDLENILRNAGHWQVDVYPEEDGHFLVNIKGHSDTDFFYENGSWWKASLEIEFRKDKEDGKCSVVKVYVYDTLTCEAPIRDDPDRTGRMCFQRIRPDSKAEVDLRDRIGRVLQKAYKN